MYELINLNTVCTICIFLFKLVNLTVENKSEKITEINQIINNSDLTKNDYNIKCCLRKITSCNCPKISIDNFRTKCDDTITDLKLIGKSGFIIENKENLPDGLYTILAYDRDFFPLHLKLHFMKIAYAAINIHSNCFKQTISCFPHLVQMYSIQCGNVMDQYNEIRLILLKQKKIFPLSVFKEFESYKYEYKNFYKYETFSGPPLRSNQFQLKLCKYQSQYERYMSYSSDIIDPSYFTYFTDLSRPVESIVVDQFPNLLITPKMIHNEAITCFIFYEWKNNLNDEIPNLSTGLKNCNFSITKWLDEYHKHGFELINFLIQRANKWFLFSQEEYVHFTMFEKHIMLYYKILDEQFQNTITRKLNAQKVRMCRIVSRTHLFLVIINYLKFQWNPPLDYFDKA